MSVEDLNLDDVIDHDAADDLKDRGDELEIEDEPADDKKTEAEGDGDEGADGKKTADGKKAADEQAKAEGDEKAEAEGDEQADDGKHKPDPNPMVPRARLNQVQEKRRAAEARVAELEKQLNGAQGGDKVKEFAAKVDQLYEDVEKARAEGEYKEAARLQRELDKLRAGESAARTRHMAQQEALRTQQMTAYNAVVDQVELLVPELNPSDETYDESLLGDVMAVRDGYEARGRSPADALKKALKSVLGRDVFATPSMRREDSPPAKKTDIKRNVDAAKKTPPDVQRSAPAEKPATVDPSALSDEELFDKLPESARRRMRGDFIE